MNGPALAAQFSSATDDWATPQDFFDKLDREFHFALDVCASDDNAKVPGNFFCVEEDGLSQDWAFNLQSIGLGAAWMNPPYGRVIGSWVHKALLESRKGITVVCLLPARTDTRWWHDYVIGGGAEVRFVRGRLKFGNAKNSAPFPSAVVVFRPPVECTGEYVAQCTGSLTHDEFTYCPVHDRRR